MGRVFRFLFWIFFLVALLGLAVLSVSTQELDSSSKPWTLIGKVEDCKNILRNSPKLEFKEQKSGLVKKQIALCVLNLETGDIFEQRYWLDQKEIEKANLLRKTSQNKPDIPRFAPVSDEDKFRVINNWWNNWNSDWSLEKISDPTDNSYIIAANKFLVPNSYVVYSEDKTGPKYSDIIYAPYSKAIHTNELVQNGIGYIEDRVTQAFLNLRSNKVESRAFPGKLVADTMREKFIKEILINEQTDPDLLLNKAETDEEKLKVLEKVLVRYGLNGDKAFRYTVSKAGASGMAQLMTTTYSYTRKNTGIVQKYLDADLIRDIDLGRLDPVNAITAEILVLDDKLSEVKSRVSVSEKTKQTFHKLSQTQIDRIMRPQRIFNDLSQDQLEEVRAMSYNGGSSKYDIHTGTLKTKARGRKAKLGLIETKGFIAKLRVIRYLELFE